MPTTHARLYLIRHAETAWTLDGRHTSRSDIPINERGVEESRRLGEALRAVTFDHVLTSPRLRARQTCEQIGLSAAAAVEPDLVEWDYGDYEGLRSAEIRAGRPDWDLFRDGCPRGEMPAQVSDRADRLIARLRATEGNTAVCTHGHFGRVLCVRWIGQSVEQARHFLLSTASVSVLGYEHSRTDLPAIVQWNADAPPR